MFGRRRGTVEPRPKYLRANLYGIENQFVSPGSGVILFSDGHIEVMPMTSLISLEPGRTRPVFLAGVGDAIATLCPGGIATVRGGGGGAQVVLSTGLLDEARPEFGVWADLFARLGVPKP